MRAALHFVPVKEVDQVLAAALMPLPTAVKTACDEQEQPLTAFAPLVQKVLVANRHVLICCDKQVVHK